MNSFPFENTKSLLRLPLPNEEKQYNSIKGNLDKYEIIFDKARTWKEKLRELLQPTHEGLIEAFLARKEAEGASIAYLDIAGGQGDTARSLLLTNRITTATVLNLTDLRTLEQQTTDQSIALVYLLGDVFRRKSWNEIQKRRYDLITCCPIRGSQINIPDSTSVFGHKVIPGEIFAPILTRMIGCLAPGGLLLSQVPMQVYAEGPMEGTSKEKRLRLKKFLDWLDSLKANDPSLLIHYFKDISYYNADPEYYWSMPKLFDCGILRIERIKTETV